MSTNNNIFINGSQWLKVDFHLHTDAAKEFVYKGEENDFCIYYFLNIEKNMK